MARTGTHFTRKRLMTIQPTFPACHRRASPRRAGGARHADDGTVSGNQGGQSGPAAVLPNGRFLRAVLRGCRDRLARARHHADQARQASGRRHPDVRRSGGTLGRLSASPDRAGFPGRSLRADGRSGRRARPRQQERGAPRRRAAGDAGDVDRRHAARCADQQLPARDRADARLGRRGSARACLDRYFDVGIHRHGMRGQANSRRRCRASIPTRSSSPTRSMAIPISGRRCANGRR